MNHSPQGKLTAKRRGRKPNANNRAVGQVQSLMRALALLERIAGNKDGVTLTDIAQQVGLAPSTVHRLLATMEQADFVQHNDGHGKWYIGVKAFSVGNAFLTNRNVVAESRPFLQTLMEESGETSNLAVLKDREGVIVGQVECREMMRMVVPLGSRTPLHASGVGKALLAGLSDFEVTSILHQTGLNRYTDHTLDTVSKLRDALTEIRIRGYAIDNEEHAVGLRCVAATIFDELSEPIAAISLSGPRSRIPDERLPELGSLVMNTAKEITNRLGGQVPVAKIENR